MRRIIGNKIKQYRQALNLSGEELAKRSHTSQTTISDIERGERSPTVETLMNIADALGVDIRTLLPDHEDQIPPDVYQLIELAKLLSTDQRAKLTTFIRSVVLSDR